jgi:SAM-dependent methyltransferase
MHYTQYVSVEHLIKTYFPKDSGKVAYDIGSYDVNGSHKQSIVQHGLSYVGVDISAGPNVDLVVQPYDWSPLPDNGCELVLSGSCLEHVEAPWLWAKELERRLMPGGTCILYVPFMIPEHRFPIDCWRILPDGLRFLFSKWVPLECLECKFTPDGSDAYFVGKKKGPQPIPDLTTKT